MGVQTMEMTRGTRAASYRAVWRWHFYAGLIVAPVLAVLAITGGIYLFDREIDAWWNRDLLVVEPAGDPLPLAAQQAAVAAAWPQEMIAVLRLPRAPTEATRWRVSLPDGEMREVFVDPYAARITGAVNPAWQPMEIIRRLHGTLLAGEIGSHVVELVACWTLVMFLTGMFLWWPKHWHWWNLVPRRGMSGRVFWREWHAIPSLFNATLVIFLVLSGLPWSVFWGKHFAQLGEWLPFVRASPNFSAPPQRQAVGDATSATPDHALHDGTAARLPWTVRHIEMPIGSGGRSFGIADIEPMLRELPRDRFGPGVRVFYPVGESGVFMISYVPDMAQGQRTIYIDPGSGKVLGNIGWANYSPAAKAVEWGVMTHMGTQFGRPNQLIGALVCSVLTATVFAGVMLWWQRRPLQKAAKPKLAPGDRLPGFMRNALVTLGIVFPLLGASMLVMLLVDRLLALRGKTPRLPAC